MNFIKKDKSQALQLNQFSKIILILLEEPLLTMSIVTAFPLKKFLIQLLSGIKKCSS